MHTTIYIVSYTCTLVLEAEPENKRAPDTPALEAEIAREEAACDGIANVLVFPCSLRLIISSKSCASKLPTVQVMCK